MIYKGELLPYKRTQKNYGPVVNKTLKLFTFQHILLYLSAFFCARVFLLGALMPFGVAFFIACYGVLERKISLTVGVAVIAGYFSSFRGYLSLSHVIATVMLVGLSYFISSKSKNKIYIMSMFGFIINTLFYIFFHAKYISGGLIGFDTILAIFESIILTALSYIFSFGIPIYFEKKKRKMLAHEEMVYIGLIAAIVVSGMWDIKYLGFSLKNMIAFFIVLAAGYSEGSAIGAALGASLGLISTLTDSMPVALGIFAFCGLIAGVFKDLGKLITCAAFIISAALLSFYTAGLLSINSIFVDTLIPSVIFIAIPRKSLDKVVLLLDGEKRSVELQKSYVDRVKDIVGMKLLSVSNTLSGLSEILEENVDNDLARKTEVNGMVEKLTDRVCSLCDNKDMCWKRDMYYTYNSFLELLRAIEKSGKVDISQIPDILKRKCVRPNELIKQANYIYDIFRLNNRWRKKLVNSRLIVSDQIKGISGLVKSMMGEVSTSMEFKNDIEEEIAVALDKRGLDFDDVIAVKNKKERYEVTIYKKPCSGQQLCSKEFIGAISRCLGIKMVRDSNKCKINTDCSMCQFRLVEAINYNMSTAIAKAAKENVSGDDYSFGEISDGRYMMALSDGMGSGAEAAAESNTTITLLERFLEAGYERNTAIKAINSVLVFKSDSESYSTVDVCLVDLYSGFGEFIKIGSAPTFIKTGSGVSLIRSTNLPVGILDDVDIESEIVELKNGDMIVMVSDGVSDASSQLKEKWIINMLREIENVNPKEVAEALLKRAKELSGEKLNDDMTVMVSKIWKLM